MTLGFTVKVCGSVTVVTMLAIGSQVVATVYALVGNRGVKFFIVIFVGGMPCMGAYLVRPLC